jgi:translation initiation factor IF-3
MAFDRNRNKDLVLVNHNIHSAQVRCIDASGNSVGLITLSEAIKLAEESHLDLVQVSPVGGTDFPACRILDYAKYKYEQTKKKKEAFRKQRESAIKTKEIKFRPGTDKNDLRVKANKAAEILADGDRIKISIMFRGR